MEPLTNDVADEVETIDALAAAELVSEEVEGPTDTFCAAKVKFELDAVVAGYVGSSVLLR